MKENIWQHRILLSFRGAKPIGLVCDIGISGFCRWSLTEIARWPLGPSVVGQRPTTTSLAQNPLVGPVVARPRLGLDLAMTA